MKRRNQGNIMSEHSFLIENYDIVCTHSMAEALITLVNKCWHKYQINEPIDDCT